MGITTLFTELGSAIVAFLQTFFPGLMTSLVQTFDAFAFVKDGDSTQMTAIFGWIVVGSILGLGIWLIKKIGNRAFGGNKM